MARGSSVIDVAIIGDAKKLIDATKDADKAVGGLLTSAAKVGVVGLGVGVFASNVSGFVDDALKKADTFSDSFDNLAGQIGKIDADKVKDVAFSMENIGLSADEVGTLADKFASFATAAGVAAPTISELTPDLLDIAVAVSAKTGKTLDEVVTDIGKAAAGQQKPISEYGILIDKTLNPDDTLRSILDQLKTKFGDAKTAMDDVSGAQDILTAKWDNFTARVGLALEGPIHDLQLGLIYTFDYIIPTLIGSFSDLAKGIEDFARFALGPIGQVNDALGALGRFIGEVSANLHSQFDARTVSESQVVRDLARFQERNGQGAP